ncbi:MAG: DUF359 domain-containing protein [Methanosarcinaceae archaeon]|nr:DUF359 domain-containing protein [Methanosarcinaceae archaeon]MDD4748563.1 DUF359 domain-containing protein [Methanosarcinaceae archaeon]
MKAGLELPKELRPLMKKPLGTLYRGKGKDTIEKFVGRLENPTKLISVGDVTTFHLLEAGVFPDLCIVDDRTQRFPVSDEVLVRTKDRLYREVLVDNPAGTISEELILTLEKAVRAKTPVRIFVRGEEDLATLPVIALAPLGTVVLYGQPDEGVVFVEVTEEKKAFVLGLFKKIIPEKSRNPKMKHIWRILNGYFDS